MDSSEDSRQQQVTDRDLDTRGNATQSGAVEPDSEANLPRSSGKKRRGKGEKKFLKVLDLGSHRMSSMPSLCRTSHVLFHLMRISSYGGVCYTTPTVIAKELRMEVTSVRRSLRALEADGAIKRKPTRCGGSCFVLNPLWYQAGDSDDEARSISIWADDARKIIERIANKPPRAD